VVEVRVTGVHEPAVAGVGDDGGVAAAVAVERHERDVGVEAGELAHGGEVAPGVAGLGDGAPPRRVRPLVRQVPAALGAGGARGGGVELALVQVHGGVREVDQAAGVIEIEVGHDDVAHVSGGEAERGQLGERGLAHVEGGAGEPTEVAGQERGVAALGAAPAGVDQHQAVARRLDQQAVADHGAAAQAGARADAAAGQRAHGAAVEVMHAHAASMPEGLGGRAVGQRERAARSTAAEVARAL
jgi:hypothetical protein